AGKSDRLVATKAYRGVQAVNKTWYDRGLELGWLEGMEEWLSERRVKFMGELLEYRFGPLSPHVEEQVRQWPAERLFSAARRILDVRSLGELGFEDLPTPDLVQDSPPNPLTTTAE